MAKAKAKTSEETANKMGRPRIEIDLVLLQRLAETGCSIAEVAAMLRRSGLQVDMRTLKRRLTEADYRSAWEEGQLIGKVRLRSQMMKLATMTSHPNAAVQMCQFLARNWLGMNDKTSIELTGAIEVSSARERLTRKIDALSERIARRVDGIAAAVGAQPPAREPV